MRGTIFIRQFYPFFLVISANSGGKRRAPRNFSRTPETGKNIWGFPPAADNLALQFHMDSSSIDCHPPREEHCHENLRAFVRRAFAFGAAIFVLPAGEAVAQTVPEEGCPLLVSGSVYNPADEACDCPGETQMIFEFRESEAPGARLYQFCAVPLTDAQCGVGMNVDLERNICTCSTFGHRNFETGCAAPVQCNGGIVNGNNECECATGFTLNGGNCDSDSASLADIPQYQDDECTDQGWFSRLISDGTNSASVCDIPLAGQPDSGPVARQFSASVRTGGCVLRADSALIFPTLPFPACLCAARRMFLAGAAFPRDPSISIPPATALRCPARADSKWTRTTPHLRRPRGRRRLLLFRRSQNRWRPALCAGGGDYHSGRRGFRGVGGNRRWRRVFHDPHRRLWI